MIEQVRIVQTQAQPTAVIRLTVPRAEIQRVMGPAIADVMGVLGDDGAWHQFMTAHYRRTK